MHQPRSIITYLRTAGFIVGAALFIIMAYRSGQSINDPAATKGTRNQQTYVSFDTQGSLQQAADASYTTAAAVAAPSQATTSSDQSSDTVATTTSNSSNNAKTSHGKALGIQKHQN